MITTLRPASQGNYNNWTLGAGASKPVALQGPNDDDASYITASTAVRDSFVHDGLAAWVFGITTHSVRHYSKSITGGGGGNWPVVYGFLRRAGVDYDGAGNTMTAAYINSAPDVDLISATPTREEVNATEIGVWLTSAGYGDARTSSLRWPITHKVAPRGFVCIIGQWLGPLVAVGLSEMRRLAMELSRRSPHLITPDEYMTAWRELREARNRRFYFRPASRLYVPAGI